MLWACDEGSEHFSIIPAINWHINLENARALLFAGNQEKK